MTIDILKLRHFISLFCLLFTLSVQAEARSPNLALSDEEKDWLKAHPVIILGIDPDWAPFEFYDEQRIYSGIAADYIDLISKQLGVEMRPFPDLSWSQVLDEARAKNLDVLPAAMATTQRKVYLNFTSPYLDFPMVIITRDDAPFISSLDAMNQQQVAVVKNYVSHELLDANHTNLNIVPYNTLHTALTDLSTGEVDAFVGNLASVTHAIKQLGLGNLKVAAHTPYSFKLGMGVRNDWPELTSILDKTLGQLDPSEVRKIQNKWISLQFEKPIDLVRVAFVIAPFFIAALFIVAVVMGSNRKLRQEIVQREEAEKQLRLSEEALHESQRTAHIGWWQWDLDKNTLKWSNEVYSITGRDPERFTPTAETFMSVVHPDDVPALQEAIGEVLNGYADEYSIDFRIIREDSTTRHVHSYGRIYGSSIDNSQYFAGVLHDINEQKIAEEKLRSQAYSDELTGLPNRNYFMEQLDKALAQSRRHNKFSALLFFDLDNFKLVNDSLGHQSGDKLLAEVGVRLKNVIRKEDTAARLGGDEFVVISVDLSSDADIAADQALLIAEKIHDALSMPFEVEGHEHHLTMSTGISLFPMGNDSSNDILRFADTAMYRAKESGRDAIRFFQPSMQAVAEERFALQGKLRHAISNHELELHYQPQFNHQEKVIGAECLLRWTQSEIGNIPPDRFIPLAEESGIILEIGDWVLREACKKIAYWNEHSIAIENLAINVSPRQFHQDDFVSRVTTVIHETGIQPSQLELELTEGMLVENIEEVTSKILQLQQMGIRFSIDDFGTGYSSLRYLKQLPLDRLKIDQSFVRDIHNSDANAHIVETIISMAHHLEFEIIAEGVETTEEMKFLELRGCKMFQGYYFSKPLPEHMFTALLKDTHS